MSIGDVIYSYSVDSFAIIVDMFESRYNLLWDDGSTSWTRNTFLVPAEKMRSLDQNEAFAVMEHLAGDREHR